MKYLLILFAVFTQTVYSQETPITFWNKRCNYITDGNGKSLGLKIKVSFPCKWTQANGEHPHVVKKFIYSFEDGKSIMQGLTITKMPAEPSKQEINEMFSQRGLRDFAVGTGTFVSGRRLKIDGLDCGEVIMKLRRESPLATIYLYFIHYYIIFKDKLIVLSFTSGSKSESTTNNLYSTYKSLYQAIATNTIILSKWE